MPGQNERKQVFCLRLGMIEKEEAISINKRGYFFGIAVNRVFSGFVKRDIDSESFGFL